MPDRQSIKAKYTRGNIKVLRFAYIIAERNSYPFQARTPSLLRF